MAALTSNLASLGSRSTIGILGNTTGHAYPVRFVRLMSGSAIGPAWAGRRPTAGW